MKITSRAPGALAVEPTDIEVQTVMVDSISPASYATAGIVASTYYMQVVLRIPLKDSDLQSIHALTERMHNMQHAKLLEVK